MMGQVRRIFDALEDEKRQSGGSGGVPHKRNQLKEARNALVKKAIGIFETKPSRRGMEQ